jgi:hypothetical protein
MIRACFGLQEFGEVLERYSTEMEQYHTKNEMVKRDHIATEVRKGKRSQLR